VKKWLGPVLAAPATLWLLAAFAAPFLIVLLLSVQAGSDPFAPLSLSFNWEQFAGIFSDDYHLRIITGTTLLALCVCLVTTLLGYPLALWIVSLPSQWRPLAMSAVLVPLLINVVVRSLGIELLLAPDGPINAVFALFGFNAPHMLYNYGAIAVGLTQVFLPFMVLALYDVLQSTNPRVLEAAQSLGASRSTRFFFVELPLSLPGLRAGLTYVFLMASTTYVSARMLGGKIAWTTGMLVWQDVLENLNAQFASALSLVMTVISVTAAALIAIAIWRLTPWLGARPSRTVNFPAWLTRLCDGVAPSLTRLLLIAGLALLLLPLVLVLVQSFNNVPQATMAGFKGFTLQWYRQLFSSGLYLDSVWTSLELALATSAVTVILAVLAAFALVRTRFTGKTALEAFWMFPISLPQVAIGIGMLHILQMFLLLPPFLGLLAVHVMVTLPFCIGLLRASVAQLDLIQEDAAASLGAGPWRRIVLVIIPGLASGLAAAAIVAMLLSFEEVTITSFLTTARMTTLPVRIYAEASYSLEPTVFCISTLMIAFTVAALIALGRLVRLDHVFSR
jgi:ABC-type spermidine/putrescine transport system permease subunit II